MDDQALAALVIRNGLIGAAPSGPPAGNYSIAAWTDKVGRLRRERRGIGCLDWRLACRGAGNNRAVSTATASSFLNAGTRAGGQRSPVPDARDIGDSLVARGVKLSLGGSLYDPAGPMGKMFFNILATFAEFEVDLLKLRTREGMAIAKERGRLKGKQPKLTIRQQAELVRMHSSGEYTIAELMEVFSVGRATVYHVLHRTKQKTAQAQEGT